MQHPIVASARTWLGTRFHHQGRLKKTACHKGGVDCLGLLTGVAKELTLRSLDGAPLINFDEIDYSHQPDCRRLYHKLSALLEIIPYGGIRPGDIILLRVDDNPQHLAIVSDRGERLGIIHAYAPARAVVEHELDSWWQKRVHAAFRIY